MISEQMSMPRVSVVIPAFNRAKFIEASVRSALDQTYAPLEVIVVDDGSTDETVALTERLARQDRRVRCVRQPTNGGPATARNRGVLLAEGDAIGFLDSDDLWEKDFLEGACAFLNDQPHLGMVFGEMTIVASDGHIINPEVIWGGYRVHEFVRPVGESQERYIFTVSERESVLHRYFLAIQATVIHRSVALKIPFNESLAFRGVEDVDFLIRLGLAGIRFGFLRRVACRQTIHEQNLLSNGSNRLKFDKGWALVWGSALDDPSLTHREARLVRRQLAQHLFSIGYAHAERREMLPALSAYARSFRAMPSWRAAFGAPKLVLKQLMPR